ncbi:MAG: hypothetical protein NVS1B4_02660 [Gemmatimonadaceae bacterium]
MPPRSVVGALTALLIALLFGRLGVWQLHRLGERRAKNALVASRLAAPPMPLDSLVTTDTAALHYRRVRIKGTPDVAHEFALAGASRNGSPGVNLMVPVLCDGGGDAVLVVRGWIYSPDGATVDASRWREATQREFLGYVAEFTRPPASAQSATPRTGVVRWMDHHAIATRLPYPLAPFYVIQLVAPAEPQGTMPARFPPPFLDEGPHRAYAVQWFAFAALAVAGGVVLLARGRTAARARHASSPEAVG